MQHFAVFTKISRIRFGILSICSDASHGPPTADITKRHVGDFGNLTADANGVIIVDYTDSIITLYDSIRSVLERTLIVHAMRDDGGTGGFSDSLTVG